MAQKRKTLIGIIRRQGMSVVEFSKQMKLHRDYVYKLHRGLRTPSVATGEKIAKSLGLGGMDELLRIIRSASRG